MTHPLADPFDFDCIRSITTSKVDSSNKSMTNNKQYLSKFQGLQSEVSGEFASRARSGRPAVAPPAAGGRVHMMGDGMAVSRKDEHQAFGWHQQTMQGETMGQQQAIAGRRHVSNCRQVDMGHDGQPLTNLASSSVYFNGDRKNFYEQSSVVGGACHLSRRAPSVHPKTPSKASSKKHYSTTVGLSRSDYATQHQQVPVVRTRNDNEGRDDDEGSTEYWRAGNVGGSRGGMENIGGNQLGEKGGGMTMPNSHHAFDFGHWTTDDGMPPDQAAHYQAVMDPRLCYSSSYYQSPQYSNQSSHGSSFDHCDPYSMLQFQYAGYPSNQYYTTSMQQARDEAASQPTSKNRKLESAGFHHEESPNHSQWKGKVDPVASCFGSHQQVKQRSREVVVIDDGDDDDNSHTVDLYDDRQDGGEEDKGLELTEAAARAACIANGVDVEGTVLQREKNATMAAKIADVEQTVIDEKQYTRDTVPAPYDGLAGLPFVYRRMLHDPYWQRRLAGVPEMLDESPISDARRERDDAYQRVLLGRDDPKYDVEQIFKNAASARLQSQHRG